LYKNKTIYFNKKIIIAMGFETILSIFLGVGLAAAAGFRVFVPLFVMSLAAHFQVIPLQENWQWVGGTTALVILGIATLVEIFAYFIPFVDNLLDTIAIPLAAISGTLVMASTLVDVSPVMSWVLAIIAGGGTATAINSATATTRVASTTTTGGIANPVLAGVETTSASVLSVLAIFLPIVAVVIVVFIFVKGFKLIKNLISK
jgi:hypothetical protein